MSGGAARGGDRPAGAPGHVPLRDRRSAWRAIVADRARPADERAAAAHALAVVGSDEAVAFLVAAVDETEPPLRAAIVEALGHAGGAAAARLRGLLDHPAEDVVRAAVRALACADDAAARGELVRIARDASRPRTVRVDAAFTLATMRDDVSRELVVDLLHRERDPAVRAALARALAAYGRTG